MGGMASFYGVRASTLLMDKESEGERDGGRGEKESTSIHVAVSASYQWMCQLVKILAA